MIPRDLAGPRRGLASLLNGLTLVGIGVVLLDFFFTGRLDQYLHPQFRPFTLVAGIIFCVIGFVYAALKPSARCCVDGECVHENATKPLRSVIAVMVLFVPLAAGVALSKDGYDQQAVLNRGFVQDITKLPVRANRVGTGAHSSGAIPPEPSGAEKDAAASEPLPQDTPARPGNHDSANPAAPDGSDGRD